MNKKKTTLIALLALTLIASIVLYALGKTGYPVLILGGLLFFILYGVWNPPEKHKSFGYRDQQRAMRAFDRTDLLDFELGTNLKDKKRKRKP